MKNLLVSDFYFKLSPGATDFFKLSFSFLMCKHKEKEIISFEHFP